MSAIRLECRAVLFRGDLVLRYVARNEADQDAYLLNRLYRTTPPQFDANLAYVDLDTRERLVRVTKDLARMPSLGSPTTPVAPFVTAVRAGQSFTEDIHLTLPVMRYAEYVENPRRPPPDRGVVTDYRGVTLTLGYFWREPGVVEEPGSAFGQPVIIPKFYSGNPKFGKATAAVMLLAVPVIEAA